MLSSRRANAVLAVAMTAVLAVAACSNSTNSPTDSSSKSKDASGEQEWRDRIKALPMPAGGCWEATYPVVAWTPRTCVAAPNFPMAPHWHDPYDTTHVGDGNDMVAMVSPGITQAVGSFPAVTGLSSIKGEDPSGNQKDNVYTIQLNTNQFEPGSLGGAIGDCPGSSHPLCKAWQQFIFETDGTGTGGLLAIQYWLVNYGASCPTSGFWTQDDSHPGDINCFTSFYVDNNGTPKSASTPVPTRPPFSEWNTLELTGSARSTGDDVSLTTRVTGTLKSYGFAHGSDLLGLAGGHWTGAEFNVLGNGYEGRKKAVFNSGASLTVRVRISEASGASPTIVCTVPGYSDETNNLGFGAAKPTAQGPGPAMMFTETEGLHVEATCMNQAITWGDTHLVTFDGANYDFQATGDFVLAKIGSGFEVQSRQINLNGNTKVAYNSAVAARLGGDQVAVCAGSSPSVYINGTKTTLAAHEKRAIAGGSFISRYDDRYVVQDATGNSLHITSMGSYLDASVVRANPGAAVSGLLGSNGMTLVSRDGTKNLTVPALPEHPAVTPLYAYGDTWRIQAGDTTGLLTPCSAAVTVTNPAAAYYIDDSSISATARSNAQTACQQALAQRQLRDVQAVLNACMLDVIVVGASAAAPYRWLPFAVTEPKVNK